MLKRRRETQHQDEVYPNMEDWPIYKLSEDRSNFVEEINAFTLKKFLQKSTGAVSDLISKTIYLERIRLKEEPWKVDPPKDKQFWAHLRKKHVKKGLDQSEEQTTSSNEEILSKIIARYSEEIVGTFKIKTFLFARRFLTFFFTKLLNTAALRSVRGLWGKKFKLTDKLYVRGETEAIRTLMKKGTVVVVPTHFSNLDSILVGYAMDSFVGLPSFSYGAGLNLYNTGYTAYFMNRLGAYRLDRRKKNPVYLETLKAMSMLSIKRGVNSLFFPGGTRSRSGKLETKLKLGLLGTVIEAQRELYQEGKSNKIFVVPLVMSYPFVLEADFLIEQHLKFIGKEHYIKSKDSFYSPLTVLKFAWKIFSKGNDLTLSFGQPMDVLGNPVDLDGNSFDQYGRPVITEEYFQSDGQITKDEQRETQYTLLLGDRIVDRFHKDNIVITSHLVAFIAFQLLQRDNPKLDLYGILRLPPEDFVFDKNQLIKAISQAQSVLFDMELAGNIQLSEKMHETPEQVLEHGRRHLGNFHLKRPLRKNKEGEIISENFNVLYYYHNRLSTYNLDQHIDWKAVKEPSQTKPLINQSNG